MEIAVNRFILLPACCALLVLLSSCAYMRDRARDFTDLVDLKYACPDVRGIGIKAEATNYLGAGLGMGTEKRTTEWFGRRFEKSKGGFFMHVLIGGFEEISSCPVSANPTKTFFGYQVPVERPQIVSQFRLGAEVVIPALHFGIYANLGEVADFFAGLFLLDPAEDDGLVKGCIMSSRSRPGEQEKIDRELAEALEAVKSPESRIRHNGVKKLSWLGDPRSVDALIGLLADPDRLVRAEVVKTLGLILDPRARDALIEALSDPSPLVREWAERALISLFGRDLGTDPAAWRSGLELNPDDSGEENP